MFTPGEDMATLPMTLVAALVASMPKADDYGYRRNLELALKGCVSHKDRAAVLQQCFLVAKLQATFEEQELAPVEELTCAPVEQAGPKVIGKIELP